LLAACERTQQAQETAENSGVFTSTLVEVLGKSGSDITYADLFVRCRSAVRKYAENQNPQFEAYENFNSWSGFLGRKASYTARRFSVYFDESSWKVDCGAVNGLPTELDKSVELALYPENEQARLAGRATTIQVGAQKSEVKLNFESETTLRYRAELTSLPVAPIPVYLQGDQKGQEILRKALEPTIGVDLTDIAEGTRYTLAAEDGNFLLKQRETGLLIQGAKGFSEASAKHIFSILKQVVQWERILALQNHGTSMDSSLVDFIFFEKLSNGPEHEHRSKDGQALSDLTLDFVKDRIGFKIKANNRTQQPLHFALFYLSGKYGIQKLVNDPVPPSKEKEYVTLFEDEIFVEEGLNEVIENFKLIVSTEQLDDFLLVQDDLEIGKIESSTRGLGKFSEGQKLVHKNEWFTKNLRVKVVRQLDQVGAKDAALAKGKIVVKSHPSVKANLSLSAAKVPTRGAGQDFDFYKALERQGLTMLNFAAGARGESESILELTNIENAEALEKEPLEIDVNMPLDENEYLLPLVFDGQHVVLGGDPSKDEQGNTHISIDHIPAVPDNRRSVGGALKLYFFKTYLKQENVNALCWAEFKDDGNVVRNKSDVANKVAGAKNILLLIHGIIGDTESLARGLRKAELDKKFDLVLTYDYENLSTPISETATKLKQQLEAAGFGANDNKQLTVLAHSMGGLVSRWLIEREGGNKLVDHLVMCGTPNNGSPFGKIDKARKIMNVLTGLAINYIPVFIPFSGAIIFLLNRSKKITPTLEQMDPSSEFMKTLNSSADPGVRYTLLAGDIDKYEEPSDKLFAKMLEKAGKGLIFDALFGTAAHDIAASAESILGVNGGRNPAPKRANVACHHLNYFVAEPGLKALAAVEWTK
jgi:pimeloyl-ACP methyl ester carboxylesterase